MSGNPKERKEWWQRTDQEKIKLEREATYLAKIRLCSVFGDSGYCWFEAKCRFAHDLHDLTLPNEGYNAQHKWSTIWTKTKQHPNTGVDRWYGQYTENEEVTKYIKNAKNPADLPDWANAFAIIHLRRQVMILPKCNKEDWGMADDLAELRKTRNGDLPLSVPRRLLSSHVDMLKKAYDDIVAHSPNPSGYPPKSAQEPTHPNIASCSSSDAREYWTPETDWETPSSALEPWQVDRGPNPKNWPVEHPKARDWNCEQCNTNNYANRLYCWACFVPKASMTVEYQRPKAKEAEDSEEEAKEAEDSEEEVIYYHRPREDWEAYTPTSTFACDAPKANEDTDQEAATEENPKEDPTEDAAPVPDPPPRPPSLEKKYTAFGGVLRAAPPHPGRINTPAPPPPPPPIPPLLEDPPKEDAETTPAQWMETQLVKCPAELD